MNGFVRLEVGTSTKFRKMEWKLDPGSATGVLRVEFHNRNKPESKGAVYDYDCSAEFVERLLEIAEGIDAEGTSVGSYFHQICIAKPNSAPCRLISAAE